MKKDEELKEQKQLQETIANLEEKLKEFEEVKFQKETMMMQIETLKRTVKGKIYCFLTFLHPWLFKKQIKNK